MKRKKRTRAAGRQTTAAFEEDAALKADIAKTQGRYVMVMVASFGVSLPTLNKIGEYLRGIHLCVPVPEEEKFTLSVDIQGHKAPIDI